MQLIDDAVDEVMLPREGKGKIPMVVNDDGDYISLQKALRMLDNPMSIKKGTDRTTRVQGSNRVKSKFASPDIDDEKEYVYVNLDVLIILMGTESGVTAVVGIPESFAVPGKKGLMNEILLEDLNDPKVKVVVHVFKAVRNAEYKDSILCPIKSSVQTITVAGAVCRAVNPEMIDIGGITHFSLALDSFCAISDLLWCTVKTDYQHLTSKEFKKMIAKVSSPQLPYIADDGISPVFIGAESQGLWSAQTTTAGGKDKDVKVECPVCGHNCDSKSMRHHMGNHLIHEREKLNAIYPCGFCGGESCQYNNNDDSSNACPVWMNKKQARMSCNLVGDSIKFSMKSAAKSTLNGPCTNRPICCYFCKKNKKKTIVHWKFNMKKHVETSHDHEVSRYISDSSAQPARRVEKLEKTFWDSIAEPTHQEIDNLTRWVNSKNKKRKNN
jgi:hypothetical protein